MRNFRFGALVTSPVTSANFVCSSGRRRAPEYAKQLQAAGEEIEQGAAWEDFGTCVRAIAMEDDDKLTGDARKVKRRLRDLVAPLVEAERAACCADVCHGCARGLPLVEAFGGLFHKDRKTAVRIAGKLVSGLDVCDAAEIHARASS